MSEPDTQVKALEAFENACATAARAGVAPLSLYRALTDALEAARDESLAAAAAAALEDVLGAHTIRAEPFRPADEEDEEDAYNVGE